MAKLNLNKLFDEIRGKLGDLVIRRRPDGTLIISSQPRYRKKGGSPAQKAHRQHVKEIEPYASHLAKVHPIYAELAAGEVARGKWMSPYNFAFADCMKPPVIQRIERHEGLIRVEASDNIGVTKVWLVVLDEAGKTLEIGDAIRAEGNWWEYAPQMEGKRIVAKAFDLPGNCTRLEA
jgi:hypothetical protein